MVPSLPCMLSSWTMLQTHHSHSALVLPNAGDISLTQTAEEWQWSSNTDPKQASHTSPDPDTAVKVHCKPPPKWHSPSPWSVCPHFSMKSHQGNHCNTHLQTLQLSPWCKPNQGQTVLSARRLDHPSQRSFPIRPSLAHPLFSHSVCMLRQVT